MKIKTLLFFFVISINSLANAANIVPHQDLTYEGAFKLPYTTNADKCIQWAGIKALLTFNPAGDSGNGSLLVTGKQGCARLAEVSIPAPVIGTLTALNTATILTDLTDIGAGNLQDNDPYNDQAVGLGDVAIVNTNQLIHTAWKYYTVTNRAEMLYKTDLAFGSAVNWAGWFQLTTGVGEVNSAEYQHYIFNIPASQQSNFGGKEVIVGANRQNSGGSYGATMYAVDVWDSTPPANGTDLSTKALISYNTSAAMSKYFLSNTPSDMVWAEVGTKSSVVATMVCPGRPRLYTDNVTNDWTISANGTYYGNRHPEGSGAKGFHAEPYTYCLSFYDPADLAAAYAGTKQPDTVQPYAFYNIQSRFYASIRPNTDDIKESGGIAYDSTNHKLYVAEKTANTNGQGVIHVFSVSDTGTTLDTTPPTAPSSLVLSDQTSSNATLTWTGSTDANNVRYEIWTNGYNSLITSASPYSYTYIDEWAVGDATVGNGWPAVTDFTFKVRAIDDYYNESNFSNEVTYGESGGPISEGRISGEIH